MEIFSLMMNYSFQYSWITAHSTMLCKYTIIYFQPYHWKLVVVHGSSVAKTPWWKDHDSHQWLFSQDEFVKLDGQLAAAYVFWALYASWHRGFQSMYANWFLLGWGTLVYLSDWQYWLFPQKKGSCLIEQRRALLWFDTIIWKVVLPKYFS